MSALALRTLQRGTNLVLVLVLAVVLASTTVTPAAAQRVSDGEVKSILEGIRSELRRLQGLVEPKHRTARFPHETGALEVSAAFDRLDASAVEIESTVEGPKVAVDAVRTLLVDGKDLIDRLEQNRWVPYKEGVHPWTKLWAGLERLAEAYSADYNADPASWEISRLSDSELSELSTGLRTQTEEFKALLSAEMKRRKSITPATRDSALASLGSLLDTAATITDPRRPAEDVEEATERLIEQALAVDLLLAENGLTESLREPWHEVEEAVTALHAAYHAGPMEGYDLLSGQ